MNLPIEIVLNAATIEYVTATWKDLSVADGVITIGERYSFPWKKLFDKSKQIAVAETQAAPTITVGTPVPGTEYFFYVSQWIDGTLEQHRISVTAATATPADLATLIDSAVDVIAAAGGGSRLKATSAAVGNVVTITSEAGYANLTVSNASSSVLALGGVAGVSAKNAGADLLAEGVKDSFDGTLPTAGASYTSYELSLMLPKGNGGFNGQTSDQEHTLMIYIDESGTPSSHWRADFDNLLNGLDATNNTVTGLVSELLAV
jgi:hypothetical protein